MPLHLLGKKSWNVYNPDNIARVKRDEVQAQAREEEDERLMQEVDAERRIKILRGERPPTPPPPPQPSADTYARSEREPNDDAGRYRKRRRLAGEDDTDRDIRFAREDAEQVLSKKDELSLSSQRERRDQQVPLLDSNGHINLFPEGSRKAEKNAEAEAEKKKKERSYEDQYTMRFSNAEGFKEQAGRQPWYSSGAQVVTAPDPMSNKNVWGNEDPMRREREKSRMDVNDPLAVMKRGVRQLKATQQERKLLNEQKRREIESLKTAESSSTTRNRRRRSRSMDSLDDFRLVESASKVDTETEAETEAETAHTSGPMRLRTVLVAIVAIDVTRTAETGDTPTGQNRAKPLPGHNNLYYGNVSLDAPLGACPRAQALELCSSTFTK
ncbi:hypothetical protein N7533_006986 [Penicillium manginii]|uniref:uncharacterized protein n=1 Tax=Penicillium manginii TaxID=203109 RepID=UPI0025483156|nr:uncharacterized protein N7533_006986 [Penicillium manginii]KAJ5749958.1 hypothetical protein N7533_006986 [Penicillium manginii]